MDTGGGLWYTQHISDDKEGYPMAENFDTVPLHPERWTDKAPFLGRWLWVLFWLAVPQAMASLLMSSLFSSQSLPYLLGQILQVVYLLGCGLVLLKLSSVLACYRLAGICCLLCGAVNAAFSFLPTPTDGFLASLIPMISVASGLLLLLAEYLEYKGHSQLLEEVDPALSQKWSILWKWYITCYLAMIGSVLLLLLSPAFALMVSLTAMVLLVAVLVFKLVYLYRTAMVFRCWEFAAQPQAEPCEGSRDTPDIPQ